MPRSIAPPRAGNSLILSLPRAERDSILSACDSVELDLNQTICEANDPIRHVYFPATAYISLITPNDAAASLEVGMVGSEGMFGTALLLDIKRSPFTGLVQGSGSAFRMTAAKFKRAINDNSSFRRRLNSYFYFLTEQIAQTAACSRFHPVDARLARWLLMAADRAHGAKFRLTHQFLAFMLGVRRAGITEAAGRLQAKNLIHYSHGVVTVLDHRGLEANSCRCYGAANRMYERSVGLARNGRARIVSDLAH